MPKFTNPYEETGLKYLNNIEPELPRAGYAGRSANTLINNLIGGLTGSDIADLLYKGGRYGAQKLGYGEDLPYNLPGVLSGANLNDWDRKQAEQLYGNPDYYEPNTPIESLVNNVIGIGSTLATPQKGAALLASKIPKIGSTVSSILNSSINAPKAAVMGAGMAGVNLLTDPILDKLPANVQVPLKLTRDFTTGFLLNKNINNDFGRSLSKKLGTSFEGILFNGAANMLSPEGKSLDSYLDESWKTIKENPEYNTPLSTSAKQSLYNDLLDIRNNVNKNTGLDKNTRNKLVDIIDGNIERVYNTGDIKGKLPPELRIKNAEQELKYLNQLHGEDKILEANKLGVKHASKNKELVDIFENQRVDSSRHRNPTSSTKAILKEKDVPFKPTTKPNRVVEALANLNKNTALANLEKEEFTQAAKQNLNNQQNQYRNEIVESRNILNQPMDLTIKDALDIRSGFKNSIEQFAKKEGIEFKELAQAKNTFKNVIKNSNNISQDFRDLISNTIDLQSADYIGKGMKEMLGKFYAKNKYIGAAAKFFAGTGQVLTGPLFTIPLDLMSAFSTNKTMQNHIYKMYEGFLNNSYKVVERELNIIGDILKKRDTPARQEARKDIELNDEFNDNFDNSDINTLIETVFKKQK